MARRTEEIRLSLIDGVTKGLANIGKGVNGVGAQLVKLNAAAQLAATGLNALSSAGKALNSIVTGAAAAQFEMESLRAAIGATPEEMKALDAEAARVSETLGLFSKSEVFGALNQLTSSGLSAQDALKALKPAIDLSVGGQVDLAFATDQTVKRLDQFGLSIEKAGELSNVLVTGARASLTNVRDLSAALALAGTAARDAGQPLEETVELLSALVKTGVEGAKSGNALRVAFTELSKDGSKFSAALRDTYGITTKNLVEVIEQLRGSADGGRAAMLALGRTGPVIQGLVSLAKPEFDKLREAISLTGTEAQDATKTLADTYQAAVGRITNILTNLRNQLASPILTPFANAIDNVSKRLTELAGSESWAELTKLVEEFATEAGNQISAFIEGFDFTEATEAAKVAFSSLRDNLDTIAESLKAIASTVVATVDGIQVGVAGIQVAFNGLVTALAATLERVVAADIAFRKFFGENTDALEGFRESLERIGRVRFEKTGESAAKLVRELDDFAPAAEKASVSTRSLAAASTRVGAAATNAADAVAVLADRIQKASSRSELDELIKQIQELAKDSDLSSEQILKLSDALANAEASFGKVTKAGDDTSASLKSASEEAIKLGKTGTAEIPLVGNAAKNAAEDTQRLAQAFRDANSAGQFEGALDQFERLKASGALTADQIAEIAAAAEEAGKKFEDAGDKGEDGFNRVAESAQKASDEIDKAADATERQARSLEDIFAALRQQAEESAQRNADIQAQIDAQIERQTDLLDKQIEQLQRKLTLSREELAIADQLRNQYRLVEQERLDRLAQLIARQREMNREKAEELRLTVETTSAAAPGGSESGPNGRPIGIGRQRDTIGGGESSGDGQSVPDSQVLRLLARALGPELQRLQSRGG
jgi:TP901 family phage tail tape measure protein